MDSPRHAALSPRPRTLPGTTAPRRRGLFAALAAGLISLCAAPLPAGQTPPPQTAPTSAPQPAAPAPAAPATTPASPSIAQTGLRVVVSIAPLKGIVEPLLPAGSKIDILIPPGVSEHGYEIPPAKLAAAADADLVVWVGLGLEPQLEKFLASRPRSGGVQRVQLEFAEAVGVEPPSDGKPHDHKHNHEHAEDGSCCPPGADPHLWLDVGLVSKLVEPLSGAVARAQAARGVTGPAEDARLAAARADLAKKLDTLDREFRDRLKDATTRKIIVGHDAWSRLAARYELVTVPIAGMTATEPTAKSIQRAVDTVREHKLPIVFTEPQISRRAAERIARATGARMMLIDPLGDGDYFATMRKNLDAIAASLER